MATKTSTKTQDAALARLFGTAPAPAAKPAVRAPTPVPAVAAPVIDTRSIQYGGASTDIYGAGGVRGRVAAVTPAAEVQAMSKVTNLQAQLSRAGVGVPDYGTGKAPNPAGIVPGTGNGRKPSNIKTTGAGAGGGVKTRNQGVAAGTAKTYRARPVGEGRAAGAPAAVSASVSVSAPASVSTTLAAVQPTATTKTTTRTASIAAETYRHQLGVVNPTPIKPLSTRYQSASPARVTKRR